MARHVVGTYRYIRRPVGLVPKSVTSVRVDTGGASAGAAAVVVAGAAVAGADAIKEAAVSSMAMLRYAPRRTGRNELVIAELPRRNVSSGFPTRF